MKPEYNVSILKSDSISETLQIIFNYTDNMDLIIDEVITNHKINPENIICKKFKRNKDKIIVNIEYVNCNLNEATIANRNKDTWSINLYDYFDETQIYLQKKTQTYISKILKKILNINTTVQMY